MQAGKGKKRSATEKEDKENVRQAEESSPGSGKAAPGRPAKEYMPAIGTANYAFLIVMYQVRGQARR